MSRRIFISAGEISGDRYGAALVHEIRRLVGEMPSKGPVPVFVGMGGDAMRAAGVDVRWDVTDIGTVGFIEPIRYLFRFWRTYREIKKSFRSQRPDLVVPIDFQGFNVPLCQAAHALSIPVLYFIGPQFWQWGKRRQAEDYVRFNRHVLTIFKEEQAYYQAMGVAATYIGHPLLDLLKTEVRPIAFSGAPFNIGIFPGSRPQEIEHVAPRLMAAARVLQDKFPGKVFVSVAHPRYAMSLRQMAIAAGLREPVFWHKHQASSCDVALVTSGTMTLELALLGVPLVSVYALHPLSYRVAKWLVGKKIAAMGHFSLPNLLLKTRFVPEFMQDEATPEAIAQAAEKLLTNADAHATIQQGYAELRVHLGSGGAVTHAAKYILDML